MKLKSCPFCGFEDELTLETSPMSLTPADYKCWIVCPRCSARGPSIISNSMDGATNAMAIWNKRVEPSISDRAESIMAGQGDPVLDHDPVNHPSHYTNHPSGIEAITITEHFNFNVGNAIKYLWRAGLKSVDPVQDLKKAVWYIEREMKRILSTRAK